VILFLCASSPLAQPRNMLVGQLLASIVGVGLSLLFSAQLRYIAIATSVALTTILMVATNSVYPPAGATAVLAVLNGGWAFVAVVMASTGVLVVMGCVWVNLGELIGALHLGARWPLWWLCEKDTERDAGISLGRNGLEVRGIVLTEEERRVLEGLSGKLKGWNSTEETQQKSEV
jgi:hypothetical protein